MRKYSGAVPRVATMASSTSTVASDVMERATVMLRASLVNASVMLSSLRVLKLVVWSNWLGRTGRGVVIGERVQLDPSYRGLRHEPLSEFASLVGENTRLVSVASFESPVLAWPKPGTFGGHQRGHQLAKNGDFLVATDTSLITARVTWSLPFEKRQAIPLRDIRPFSERVRQTK